MNSKDSWECFKCHGLKYSIECKNCNNHCLNLEGLYPNNKQLDDFESTNLQTTNDQLEMLYLMNPNLKFYIKTKNTLEKVEEKVNYESELKNGKWWFDILSDNGKLDIKDLKMLQIYTPKLKKRLDNSTKKNIRMNALLIRCPIKESIVGLNVIDASSSSYTIKEIMQRCPDLIENSKENVDLEHQYSDEINEYISSQESNENMTESTPFIQELFIDVVVNCNMGFCTQLYEKLTKVHERIEIFKTAKTLKWVTSFLKNSNKILQFESENYALINASGSKGKVDIESIMKNNKYKEYIHFFSEIYHMRHPSAHGHNNLIPSFVNDMDIVYSIMKIIDHLLESDKGILDKLGERSLSTNIFKIHDFKEDILTEKCMECGHDILNDELYLILKKHNRAIHVDENCCNKENNLDFELYTCNECSRCFSSKRGLDIHIRSVHEKQKIPCKECCKYVEESLMNEHIKNEHLNQNAACSSDTTLSIYY